MKTLKTFFCFTCIILSYTFTNAQNTQAKLKFEEAEQDYINYRYSECISKIEELKKLGFNNPKTAHLEIMARSCFIIGVTRIDYIWNGYAALVHLQNLCDFYLDNYDIEGLEDKYKEVYNIRKELNKFPQTSAAWSAKYAEIKAKEKAKKDSIIQEFLNSFVLVEKGSFYKNAKSYTHVHRPNGYTDTIGYRPVKTQVDHDFYISKAIITKELYWALYQEPLYSYATISPENRNKSDKDAMWHHPVLGWLTKNMELAYPGDYAANYAQLKSFIEKLNKVTGKKFRLPSDDEWEYAFRGGQKQRLLESKYIIGGNKRKGYKYRYVYMYKNRTQFAEPNELGLVYYKPSSNAMGTSASELATDKVYAGYPPNPQSLIYRGSSHTSRYLIEELYKSLPFLDPNSSLNPETMLRYFRLVMEVD